MRVRFFTRTSLRRIDFRWTGILVAGTVVALAGVVLGAFYLQKSMLRTDAEERISLVADLKARQIESILEGQRAVAVALTHATLTAIKIEEWIRRGEVTPTVRQQILGRLIAVQRDNQYSELTILRPDGQVLISTAHLRPTLSASDAETLSRTRKSGMVQFTSIHPESNTSTAQPVLGLIAPIVAVRPDGSEQEVAYLLTYMLPSRMLYPWLRELPMPSDTAEVLLGERQGDHVTFLNEVRHRSGLAFHHPIPLANSRVLVVQAAQGRLGVLEGIDYRGVPALGAGRRIAETGWFLVAKQDKAEIYAPLFRRTMATALIGVIFLMAIALMIYFWLRMRSQIMRRENEFRFRMLFDSMADAILVTGEDCRFVEVNQVALDRLGYSREEMLRMGPLDINPPEDSAEVEERMARVLRDGSFSFETSHLRRDGSRIPVEVCSRVFEMDGRRLLLSVARDMTERLAAQAAIQAGQARVQAIFESAGVGIAIVDSLGNYLEVNPSYSALLGYSRDELLHLNLRQTTHPDDYPKSLEINRRIIAQEGQVEVVEKRYLRPDGREVWGLLSLTPIRDAMGGVSGVLGVVADITARKQMEEQLGVLNERLSLATQGAGIGIWDWDVVQDRLIWDDELYRVFGVSRENFAEAQNAWKQMVVPEDRRATEEEIEAALRGEREYAPQFRIRGGDGAIHHIKAVARVLRDEAGKPLRVVGINFDVTARVEAEEALKKNMARLQVILNSLHSGVLVVSEDGKVDLINPCMCLMFELSGAPEALIGMDAAELRQRIMAMTVDAAMHNERVSELMKQNLPAHDEEVPLSNGKTILRDYIPVVIDGYPSGRIWSYRDITVLRQVDELRMREDERMRAMMHLYAHNAGTEKEMLALAVEEMSRLTGGEIAYMHFVSPNQKTLTLTAWNKVTLQSCSAVSDKNYPVRSVGVWADCFRQRRPVIHNDFSSSSARTGLPPEQLEIRNHICVPVCEGDRVLAIAGVGNKKGDFIQEDARQLALFVSGVWNLIRRRRAEQSLIESEGILRTVTDVMPGIAACWSRDMRCLFASGKYSEWFGKKPEEMRGLTVEEFLDAEVLPTFLPMVQAVLQGERVPYRRTLRKPDGSTGTLWGFILPDRREGDTQIRGF